MPDLKCMISLGLSKPVLRVKVQVRSNPIRESGSAGTFGHNDYYVYLLFYSDKT